ncbi:MAG TPA: HEAT repeat domain-containing protein [Vicinamibacterales bacterium]|nr:HEAT repeat domain-containing protein [Vicinamibacterales bacterium]
MTAPQAPTETLSPEVAARLAEFAKACKAATRIVSMYPPTHPAIQAALARISEASKQATYNGPFAITVLPETLVVGGRGLPKPEQSVNELAVLLHQQLIIELTLLDRLDNDAWHAFLTLLAKSPEDARALGGIAKAWEETGNKAIAIKEIDYAEVLRERAGGGDSAATWDRILTLLREEKEKEKPGEGAGDAGMQDMMALTESPQRLAQFAQKLQEAGKSGGEDSIQQRKSLLELMHGLANYASERKPEELSKVFDTMAGAAAQMPPDMLLTLITDPPTGRMDLAKELQTRLTDEMISKFLVENIVKDHGANARLATAFQTLVPDPGKQQEILAAAMQQAADAFKDDPNEFESVWQKSTEMLMHYSDAKYVSDSYAQELTFAQAQSQALDVEKIGDDPPARLRAWLATLTEQQIRAHDQRLILDLLQIEKRQDAWSGVLDTAIKEIDDLVQAGELKLAQQVLDAIDQIAKETASPFASAAAAGITKLVGGPMVRHLSTYLNKATDAEFGVAKQMCKTIGPVLVKPMSDAIMGEENPKTVRRLRDILISFGPAAREYANELRSSRNPAVRRAAVDLLRALGGDAALPDLRTMLDDSDVAVQREALRAILQVGTKDAYQMLEQALRTGAERTKEAILQSLGAFRDEKATPLFLHILTNTPFTSANEGLLTQTMESLGRVASDERSVSTLKEILYRGEWWAPGRTARFRTGAARALRYMGTSSSDFALQEAATAGPGGVRKVAKAALAEPAPRRAKQAAAQTEGARETAATPSEPSRDSGVHQAVEATREGGASPAEPSPEGGTAQ